MDNGSDVDDDEPLNAAPLIRVSDVMGIPAIPVKHVCEYEDPRQCGWPGHRQTTNPSDTEVLERLAALEEASNKATEAMGSMLRQIVTLHAFCLEWLQHYGIPQHRREHWLRKLDPTHDGTDSE